MLVSPATLERWFETDAERERPSYAQHLLQHITAGELGEVRALFERQVAGQTIRWQTQIAFVAGQSPLVSDP